MAKGEEEPLTRGDVLRLIKGNGGKAEGLNLSGKVFEEAVDLSDLDLHGIILKDARFPTHFEGAQLLGATFNGSDLFGADLRSINLQYAQFTMLNNQPTCLATADLRGSLLLNTNFQGADLTDAKFGDVAEEGGYPAAQLDYTDFRGANLFRANFKDCYFYGTKLEGAYIRGADITTDTHLGDADWGNYKIGEEIGEKEKRDFYNAEHRYRHLKMWYTESGYYDIAAKLYYREKEANRKQLKLHSKHWNDRLAAEFMRALFGYGEKWQRVFYWMALVVLGSAMAFYLSGELNFLYSLYFSTISFTALGYGKWVDIMPQGWVQTLGAVESFLGVFMMALLLVTFVRKWTR
ncbi:pentapeptide repeat-containing protein [Chloroflexota bacterium]